MDIVYETLKKVPGISDAAAHEVSIKINKTDESITKSEFKEGIAKLETRLTWKMVAVGLAVVGLIKYL